MKSRIFVAVLSCVAGVAPVLRSTADEFPASASSALTNQTDRISYSFGMFIANNFIKRNGIEVDVDVLSQAIKDVLAGRELKINEQQANDILNAYGQEMRNRREQQRLQLAGKNRAEGQVFLEANRQKIGVKTREVKLPDGSTAELQYKVIADGNGNGLQPGDTAVFNLKGTLIEGKEVENLTNRKVPLNHVQQPGLREALQMMKAGSKWQIFLPSSLAYGDYGLGAAIEPGATLIYELELASVETPQPVTSDIVRVPSADEINKGDKIQVIKAEDAAEYARTNAAAKGKKP